MSQVKWPEMHPLNAREVNQLLERVAERELASACQVIAETVEGWRRNGVPAGPQAALMRQIARLNGVKLIQEDKRRCLLCNTPTSQFFGMSPVCSDCSEFPRRAGKNLGFALYEGTSDLHQAWFGVVAPTFEYPVCATLTRERGGVLKKPDPEVGDPSFDRAIHIETDDYEALFDTFQLSRRREIAKVLAESVTLELNVNQVTVSFTSSLIGDASQMELYVILLTWSLAFERSPTY